MVSVRIAGRELSEFHAKMQSYPVISPCEVDSEVFQGSNRSSLQLLHNRRGGRTMVCRIDFFGENTERIHAQSEFEALFLGNEPIEMDIGDGYFYRAVLTETGDPTTVSEYIATVEYTFRVTRHTAEQVVSVIPNVAGILCQSNVAKTDCIIRILNGGLTGGASASITLGEMEWVYTGEMTDDLILDGVNKTFTMGGENVTGNVTWTDFPYLVPGINALTVTVDGFPMPDRNAEIRYTPTYL